MTFIHIDSNLIPYVSPEEFDEQAQEIHAWIRGLIQEQYGKEIARVVPILYGGSCNAKTAKDLFAQPDIDGGLIGGASLNADDFIAIINSFEK